MVFNNSIDANTSGFQSLTTAGVWNGRTLVAGSGISITNADGTAGNPTISSSGDGFAWSDESLSFNADINHGYMVTGTATATLPSAPTLGSTIIFYVLSDNPLTITASNAHTIRMGTMVSGNNGTMTSSNTGDSVTLTFFDSMGSWISRGVQGNWSIV